VKRATEKIAVRPFPAGSLETICLFVSLAVYMSIYRINTRFIPLGTTDGSMHAVIDEQWCRDRVAEATAIFVPARVEFVFRSLESLILKDEVHFDYPANGDRTEAGRKEITAKFPEDVVIFVRHFLAKDPRYYALNFGSQQADCVVVGPGTNLSTFAHEVGHFFGLPHTFDDAFLELLVAAKTIPERVELVRGRIIAAMAAGQVTVHDAWKALDGDRAKFTDTPPDVGPPIFQPHDVAGEDTGPGSPDGILISIPVGPETAFNVRLQPDKLNVMSYFSFTGRPHLSPQQADAVHQDVFWGKHRRLIRGRWTNWVPRDGGVLRESPSVICRKPGIVELFGRGTDDRTWQNTMIDGVWGGWFSHEDQFALGATPAAGSTSPDYLLLVACDPQGKVFSKEWLDATGTWTSWQPLGTGILKDSPSIVARRPGLLEVFGHALDDRTWQVNRVDGTWGGWFPHGDSFAISATPAVATTSPDHLLLVTGNPAGATVAKQWLDAAGEWSDWEPLGGASLKGSPSILSRRPGLLEIFGRGMDDRTWQNSSVDGEWIGWDLHKDDFPIGATPRAGSMSTDHLQLFATGPNGAVSQKWWFD
jgi:hypothetical protein